jgi:NTE family protein
MPGRVVALVAVLACAPAGVATPDEVPPTSPRGDTPRLALVLSGGGARGIAHIGALRALEEAGIPVDAIAANSMGAVVGGVYATGASVEDLDDIVLSLDWSTMFSGRPDRRLVPVARRQDRFETFAGVDLSWTSVELSGGLVAAHRINRFLIEYLAPGGYAAGNDFDLLPIRFRCVATALDNGERVVLAKGDLPRAVRASMSIPVAFPPVDWHGRPLVDGLVVDNLPTDVARGFDAAVVVAVDVGSPPLDPADYESALGVAEQLSDLLTKRRNEDFAAQADVLVKPDLGDHKATRYSDFAPLIEAGQRAMEEAIPAIRAKLAAAGYAGNLERRTVRGPRRVLEGATIAEVVVRGNEHVSDKVLRRTFSIPVGVPFDLEGGLDALDRVEATDLLRHAWMEFEPIPSGLRVVLLVEEAPPNRIEVGAAYSEWEKARGVLRLLNRDTLGFGEETSLLLVASEADVGGQLSLQGDLSFLEGLGYRADARIFSDKPRFFDAEGNEINRADFQRRTFDVALQVSIKRWGLVEGGLRLGHVTTVAQPGIDLPDSTDSVHMLFAGIVGDNLDSLLWPESGQRLAVNGWWNADELGASPPFWRLRAEGRLGRKVGERMALQLDGLVGLSGDDMPVYDWYRLGGPYLIPGYYHEELKGPQAMAWAASVRYRVVGQLRVLARVGTGNVFPGRSQIGFDDLRWGMGVGVMYPSRVGPLALEIGWRDTGQSLTSLSLGWD